MSRAFVSPVRLGLMTLVILSCFGVLFYRLFDLHVLERGHLTEVAEHNREKFEISHASRGDILDQRGNKLATTHMIYEVGVDPQSVVPADMAKLPALAQIIGMPLADVQKAFMTQVREVETADGPEMQPIRWTTLHPGLEKADYEKVAALGIKSVYKNDKFERIYPGGQLAAHVLGYMSKDNAPQAGIESAMDFYLRGQDGWRETEQDGKHHDLEQFTTREVEPTDGLNVVLTIDSMLQDYAEKEVQSLVAQYQPQGVTIIMSEPSTGEVLALANYPTYDPNHYSDYPMENLKNRAISDVFEPGSTFKIVTAAAALNEGIVRPEDKFDCSQPTLFYQGRMLKLPVDDVPMGVLSVSEIVSHSSNRGAANIGVLLGPEKLRQYALAFGFNYMTGLGLPGESHGVFQPLSAFDLDSILITRVPMGHGVDATALQVHQAMATVANHGIMMEPRIVRSVVDSKGQTVVSFQPKAERRVISAHTADLLNSMLINVVSADGTAVRAHLQDITVAGKTGTAQKLIDGKYSNEHHVSTFSGYLPAERPRLVITVIVDDAHMRGTAFGGLVSAPAFHDLATQAVQYLGIQPPEGRNNLVAMKGDNLDWFR